MVRGSIFVTEGGATSERLLKQMEDLFEIKVLEVDDPMLGGKWEAPTLFALRNRSTCRRILTDEEQIREFLDCYKEVGYTFEP